jgi:hypothetical protein
VEYEVFVLLQVFGVREPHVAHVTELLRRRVGRVLQVDNTCSVLLTSLVRQQVLRKTGY